MTIGPNCITPFPMPNPYSANLEGLYGFQTELIKNPTWADIFETFRRYAEMDYSDDDQLFIFFAGHGYFDETFRSGYLVARDTRKPEDDRGMQSYVSHSVIRDIIDRMRCKHIFLVLDTCYSGTFDRLIAMRGEDLRNALQAADRDGYSTKIPIYDSVVLDIRRQRTRL